MNKGRDLAQDGLRHREITAEVNPYSPFGKSQVILWRRPINQCPCRRFPFGNRITADIIFSSMLLTEGSSGSGTSINSCSLKN